MARVTHSDDQNPPWPHLEKIVTYVVSRMTNSKIVRYELLTCCLQIHWTNTDSSRCTRRKFSDFTTVTDTNGTTFKMAKTLALVHRYLSADFLVQLSLEPDPFDKTSAVYVISCGFILYIINYCFLFIYYSNRFLFTSLIFLYLWSFTCRARADDEPSFLLKNKKATYN